MGEDADIAAIRKLIDAQFANLSWDERREAGWAAYEADFLPGAALFASARPVQAQSVPHFVERMKRLSKSTLRSFEESVTGARIIVFGTIAIAVASCEAIENGAGVDRTVEMLLLVKDQGEWRIAAQAWDKVDPAAPASAAMAWRDSGL